VLLFDIKEEMEVASQVVTTLMEQLDVFISIKPKPKQPGKVTKAQLFCVSVAHLDSVTDYTFFFFTVCDSEERGKECWEYV